MVSSMLEFHLMFPSVLHILLPFLASILFSAIADFSCSHRSMSANFGLLFLF